MAHTINSHLISYTDPEKGLSMVSIRLIESIRPAGDSCIIEADGSMLFCKESVHEIDEQVQAIKHLEFALIDEH